MKFAALLQNVQGEFDAGRLLVLKGRRASHLADGEAIQEVGESVKMIEVRMGKENLLTSRDGREYWSPRRFFVDGGAKGPDDVVSA